MKEIETKDNEITANEIKTELSIISERIRDFKGKAERDDRYVKSSLNRVVDMKIDYYDKLIEFEIFLLKLFIPILSISVAAEFEILGINMNILRCISLIIILGALIAVVLTLKKRKYILLFEQNKHIKEEDQIYKENMKEIDFMIKSSKEVEEKFSHLIKG